MNRGAGAAQRRRFGVPEPLGLSLFLRTLVSLGASVMHFSQSLFRSIAAGLVLSLLVAVPAAAQSPSYQTKPRSGGGKAARFGGATTGGKRTTSAPGINGVAPPTGGAMLQGSQRGASRPSVGAVAPSAPIKGGTAGSARSGQPFRGNAGGGTQVFSAEQFKSGSVNNNGMINAPRRGK